MNERVELEPARQTYERREWESAYRSFAAADEAAALGPDDLWRFAMAAHLTGRDDGFVVILERAHHAHLEASNPVGAARCAFWLGFHLLERGAMGPATGWLGRAARLLERAGTDRVESGYLLIPEAFQRLAAGEADRAYDVAADALATGERFGDPELVALALHLQGQARLGAGRLPEGLALLDESMVAVATGEVSPLVTGLLYCSVIGACRRIYEVGRVHEWTAALRDWCADQPDLVRFRGECLVYRSENLQLRGEWDEALAVARRAEELGDTVAAGAFYQQGEVHRLRGEHAAAEEAFLAARRHGREPQPGLALLRLAQGDVEAAAAAIRRALAETADPLRRARLLPACVEISLAAGDLVEARRGADELEQVTTRCDASALHTLLAQARGAIALAEDDPLTALTALRRAVSGWHALGAPYEHARARLLLARACRDLGDEDTARLERDAARSALERLGCAPVAAPGEAGAGRERRPHGLTPRELEVLALLATGRTNRDIAGSLFISEKTVARHVSNIFGKLGLSSRAAATAFAYEHGLV